MTRRVNRAPGQGEGEGEGEGESGSSTLSRRSSARGDVARCGEMWGDMASTLSRRSSARRGALPVRASRNHPVISSSVLMVGSLRQARLIGLGVRVGG